MARCGWIFIFLGVSLSVFQNLSADFVKTFILVDDVTHLLSEAEVGEQEGFYTCGLNIPGKCCDLRRKLQLLYQCIPNSPELIDLLKKEIYAYYKDFGYPLIVVMCPKRQVSGSVLQFVVMESKVDQIKIEGERYTRPKKILKYFETKKGATINETVIRRDLNFINRNPFRRVLAIYRAGEQSMTTDVTLLVEDRRYYRFYAGVDNTGVKTTGRQRLLAGFTWGDVLFCNQILSYQYTTSYDFHKFQAHTFQYIAFFPWRHLLNLYGGVSFVSPHLAFPSTSSSHGTSSQASGRYVVPLDPTSNLSHEVGVGFDFKRTQNNVLFSELYPKFGRNVNLSQFVLDYNGSYHKKEYHLLYSLQGYYSPGAILPQESNSAYATLRPGAVNHWFYARSDLKLDRKLYNDCSLFLSFRSQIASQNLLPSEQIGLGGYDTVRGYDERQLNYDSGVLLNAEFRAPAFSVIRQIRQTKTRDSLQFLCFLDYGTGANYKKIPHEPKHDYLLGIGPGVRYTFDSYVAVRFDWGFKLHHAVVFAGGDSMIHFSAVANY